MLWVDNVTKEIKSKQEKIYSAREKMVLQPHSTNIIRIFPGSDFLSKTNTPLRPYKPKSPYNILGG